MGSKGRPYSIREGRPTDMGQSTQLALLAFPERSAKEWLRALRHDLAHPDRHLVVAESGGAVIGYGRARLFEPEADAPADTAPHGYYLTGVFVSPNYRSMGVGAALTRARLDWISERAIEAWYFANARNSRSIRLHSPFGFEEVTRRFSFPGLAFEGGEGILFRLPLSQR
jgi:ribosomal protein S18 acetylase RimI-like enzyme